MTDPVSGERLAPGNAVVAANGSRGSEHTVLERCRWRTEQGPVRLRMSTTQQLADRSQPRLAAVQRHPKRGEVTVSGDFEMSHMPIWGNACTVSFEPYLTREVPAGAELAWSLTYRVGRRPPGVRGRRIVGAASAIASRWLRWRAG